MGYLSDIQNEQVEWAQHNFPKATPVEPFLGMVEEMGELSHAFLKSREGIRSGTNAEETRAKIVDAIGDLTIFIMDFCSRMNIDFEETIIETWLQVKERDWVKYPKNGKTE